MKHTARTLTAALALTAVVLLAAAPAAWAGDSPLQSVTAAAGPGLDPVGPDDPEPDDGDGPTTQGGPTIDPDG